MKTTNRRWLFIIPALCWTPVSFADYKSDIGYTELETLLGASMPTGANVKVTQVEASSVDVNDDAYPIYAPDTTNNNPQFAGKTFDFPGTASTSSSDHATGVGGLFYGNDSIAPDIGKNITSPPSNINKITSYEANAWLNSIASNTAIPPANGSRIANHSWVGGSSNDSPTVIGSILRKVDRQVERNEFIQVVGMNNRPIDSPPSYSPLLGSAFNVIAVGRTDSEHDYGYDVVDDAVRSPYRVAGRTRPDLVAPMTSTSAATPIVSAAAALLVETGHNGGSTLSKGSTDINGVGTIYNAERTETIKAALMAGADRITANTPIITANITDYRSSGHQTSNGLDDRFGAGQVNILHSYQIIAAGEQNSLEDGGTNQGGIVSDGFDYDTSFGGNDGSNTTATYKFSANTDLKLSASLVWNLGVSNNASLTTTLHELNLELFDVTDNITSSLSASTIDNTENLWVNLIMGHNYELLVKSGKSNFSWDYALAWHISPSDVAPVPVPGAFYLFASAIAGLAFVRRRKA